MNHKSLFTFFLIAILLIAGCSTGHGKYERIEGFAQGGTFHIMYSRPAGVKRAQVEQRVNDLLTAIDNSLSGYNKGSLLSRFNAGEEITPDTLFIGAFNRSKGFGWRVPGHSTPLQRPCLNYGVSASATEIRLLST